MMNVIQLVSNKVWGGGERYAFDLAARLLIEGSDVRVITRGAEAVDERFRELDIPIEHAPFKGYTDFKTPGVIVRTAESFPGNDQIIIHAHDFKNAFLAIRAKRKLKGKRAVKVVVTRHLIKQAKSDIFNRYIYRNIDALVFISLIVRDEFLSSQPDIDFSKLHVIYNSIYNPPTPDFIGKIFPDRPVNSVDKPVSLLFMGRISPEKGLELLLSSLNLLKEGNWILRIGGTGDSGYVDSLKRLTEELGLAKKIEWLGYISDIWSEIKRADVGVVPSVWREPFGLTILEFMSQGVPVVTTRHGAQSEILKNDIDSLLSAPEASDFSIQLDKIISNKSLRDNLGRNAYESFKRFDYEHFFSRILSVYGG